MAIGASPTNPSTGNGLGPCKSVGSEKPKASIGGITCPNEREFKKHGREETEQKAPRILHQRAWFLVLKTGTINHFFRWFHDIWITLWFYCQIFRWSEFLFSCFFRGFFYGIEICDFGYMYLYTSLSQIHAFLLGRFFFFQFVGGFELASPTFFS